MRTFKVISHGVALLSIGAGLFLSVNIGAALVGVGVVVLVDNYME